MPDTQTVLIEVQNIRDDGGSRQEAYDHVELRYRNYYLEEGQPEAVAYEAARRVADYILRTAEWEEDDDG
jgi:hypothetical protein